jgi:hypothetical protein
MKKTYLCLFLFILSFTTQAYVIVSDLDDTLKITNAQDLLPASYNGIFTRKLFSGVRSYLLGSELSRDSLHVVSASPNLLKPKIEKLFSEKGLVVDSIHLRKDILENKLKFKVRVVTEILNTHEGDVILIGDDVDKDPEVYSEIRQTFGSRIKATYIRPIRHREFQGTPILTTFDLANYEFWAGRLDLFSLFHVIDDLETDAIGSIIPSFAWCPRELSWNCETTMQQACTEVSRRIEHHCQLRDSDGKL